MDVLGGYLIRLKNLREVLKEESRRIPHGQEVPKKLVRAYKDVNAMLECLKSFNVKRLEELERQFMHKKMRPA